jgi:hypothetical protein
MPRVTSRLSGCGKEEVSIEPTPRCDSSYFTCFYTREEFVPEKYFSHDVYWREVPSGWDASLDPRIDQSKSTKMMSFNGGPPKIYTGRLIRVSFRDGSSDRRFYYVEEKLENEERRELLPFCGCRGCRSLAWMCCLYCCGCVSAVTHVNGNVIEARRLRVERNGVPLKRHPVWLKICVTVFYVYWKEIIAASLLFSIPVYYFWFHVFSMGK